MAQQAKARPVYKARFVWHQYQSMSDTILIIIITLCEVIHAILKGAVGFGSGYAKMEIVCFEKGEDYWAAA